MAAAVTDRPVEPVSVDHLHTLVAQRATEVISSAALDEAVRHHLSSRGKLLRGSIVLDVAARLGVCRATALKLAACVELLHNASLIHDDVQDRDAIRRGRPSLWAVFDVDTAICTGDHLIAAAYATLAGIAPAAQVGPLVALVSDAIRLAAAGQCAERSLVAASRPTLDAYREVAALKTGALFALPAQLVFQLTGETGAIRVAAQAGRDFAVAYQILDDLADELDDGTVRGPRPGALNVLSVICACHGVNKSPARAHARELARDHLLLARGRARELPAGTGTRYVEFADTLGRKLH